MDIRFDGKRALVTGAGKGIGRCIALKLAKCGAKVVAISRTKEDLDSLKKQTPNIETHTLDLADWDATRKLLTGLGPVDLLVNNAGTSIVKPFLEFTKEELDKVFKINFDSVFNVTQMIAKGMVDRKKGGAIVMISSALSFKAVDQNTVYCSTKAALDQFTRCLALELGPHKIRVNAVNPTITLTKLSKEVYGMGDPKTAQPLIDKIPLKRLGEVEDMANATLFLLSDKADMINGVIMSVDGGVTVAL